MKKSDTFEWYQRLEECITNNYDTFHTGKIRTASANFGHESEKYGQLSKRNLYKVSCSICINRESYLGILDHLTADQSCKDLFDLIVTFII